MSEKKSKDKPKKKVLSLFSGCGGMDLGFEGGFSVKTDSVRNLSFVDRTIGSSVKLKPTSFETVFACDIKKSAFRSWTRNFHRNTFQLESIVELVKQAKSGQFQFPNADIVTGGFPCQDFSVAGKRKGFNSEKSHDMISTDVASVENRGMLYFWMREVIGIVQPNVFIAENVKGLVSLGDVKNTIANDFRSTGGGYLVLEPRVLHAGDYGVPQMRERVFFIGLKKSALKKEALSGLLANNPDFCPFPPPSHSVENQDFVSCFKYLLDLPEPDESGDPSHKAYSKAKWYGKHCQGQTEIKLDGLAPTIRSEHHGNIEFRRLSKESGGKIKHEFKLAQRRLSVRECARIQTFPDEFQFVTNDVSASDAYKLIGNAVPPLLAYHFAFRLEQLWEKLFKKGE